MTDKDKQIHDLKFELRQLRERVDKLEQMDIEHRKCHAAMNSTIMMQFQLINELYDLSKDIAMMVKEEEE